MVKKTHEYSMEWIYHFTCSECKNWWSWATMEVRGGIMGKRFYCPHCGVRDTAQRTPKTPTSFSDRPA